MKKYICVNGECKGRNGGRCVFGKKALKYADKLCDGYRILCPLGFIVQFADLNKLKIIGVKYEKN